MMTEERPQSPDTEQLDGIEADDTNGNDDHSTTDTSSAPRVRRSRFFRSKRKQRFNEEHSNQVANDTDELDGSVNPLESPEQPSDELPTEGISISDPDTPIKPTITKRSFSPPPPPPSDDTDDLDANSTLQPPQSSILNADIDAERHTYSARQNSLEKKTVAQARPSLPAIISTSYQRKKSQSVKLTRIDPIDAYQKKNVRFADDFGLDLSQVKVIKSDELPHVPIAAFKDLHISAEDETNIYQERMRTITYLEQKFENPIHTHGFEDRVSRHKVVLEQANAIDNRVYGTIKIISVALNKRVKVRLTTDNWTTHQDYDATYITDSFDGTHDRFSFTLEIHRDRIVLGNSIQFCIVYESYVCPEYWDSNYQQNYRFECISRSIPDYTA